MRVGHARPAQGVAATRCSGARPVDAAAPAVGAAAATPTATSTPAAITYFSFLALFPLLLLAVSIARVRAARASGRAADPVRQDHRPTSRARSARRCSDSIKTAINARAGVGIIGLVGVLLTGLGWIGNLRTRDRRGVGAAAAEAEPVKERVGNLAILVGLGLGTARLARAHRACGPRSPTRSCRCWASTASPAWARCSGSLGIAGHARRRRRDLLLVLVRLPRRGRAAPDRRCAARCSAAVGFEMLKIVGTYTVASTANSPTAGPFAGLLAVLIWIQLVAPVVPRTSSR